jgi:hypothetical protein
MKAGLEPNAAPGEQSSVATSRLRTVVVFAVILALEWRFADPATVASDPVRFAIPWAMAALVPIFALGLWAYGATAAEHPPKPGGDFKVDALRGLLAATCVYLAIFVYERLF